MRLFAALLVSLLLFSIFASDVSADYPLTLDQRKRFDQYLPRCFAKLEARDPVHVIGLGDSLMGGYVPIDSSDGEKGNPLYSFSGHFLSQLAREFFYPGGVRLLNPARGLSSKLTDLYGDEITYEDLTIIDGTALDGLRRATTDAFLHEPDLVMVQFGTYDAFQRISIDVFKRSLQEIIDAAKQNKSDIVLFSPGLIHSGQGEIPWGIGRPYAVAAREVAQANGVLFIDIGKHMARKGGGVDPDNHPEAAMEIVGDRIARSFYFGPKMDEKELVHPNFDVQRFLGEVAFQELKDGPPDPLFTVAGIATYENAGLVKTVMSLRNQTNETQQGSVGALAVGGSFLPVDGFQRFSVPANATTQLVFRYARPVVGKTRDGADLLFPIEPGDDFCRLSYFIENSYESRLLDLPVRVGPVTALWKSRQFINVGDRIRIEWDLVNGTDKAISGTFQVGMADRVGEPTNFSVSPLGTKSVFSLFEFKNPAGDVAQFQQDVWIQIDVDGKKIRFTREMEATKDLVLGEQMSMQPWVSYGNASPVGDSRAQIRPPGKAAVRFDADESALYVVAGLKDFDIPDLGDKASLKARLFVDARPMNEVRNFGVVEPIEVYTRGQDGPGTTPSVPLGCFGNGYNMILDPRGITSVLTTGSDGSRLLEIRVPRSYLHRHEWELGSLDSLLGVRLELTVADSRPDAPEPFPSENRFETSSPTFAHEGAAIYGFGVNDARSLSTLRLSRQPVKSWSVQIY